MVVSGRGNGDAEQILIIVHRFDYGTEEQQKLRVLIGRGAGRKQVLAAVRGNRPVVVLAAAVDACKGFLVEQTDKAVLCGYFLHDFHCKLIVVCGDIGGGMNRRQLVLGRSHLVMLGLRQDPQFPELIVELFHISGHTGLDDAEVMVIHFLSLGRLCAEQGAARKAKVGAPFIHFLCDKEVFLLRPHRAGHSLYGVVAEQAQDAESLFIQRLHRAKKRRLLIQCVPAVGAECRRDAERPAFDERI